MHFFTLCGLLGVVCVICAYALLATGKVTAEADRYQGLNILGTAGILVSLIGQWNLPAFIANAAWILIGITAVLRNRWRRKS